MITSHFFNFEFYMVEEEAAAFEVDLWKACCTRDLKTILLKSELGETFNNKEIAYQELFRYIEIDYNRNRYHSTLGYYSPVDFERLKKCAYVCGHFSGAISLIHYSIFNAEQIPEQFYLPHR